MHSGVFVNKDAQLNEHFFPLPVVVGFPPPALLSISREMLLESYCIFRSDETPVK